MIVGYLLSLLHDRVLARLDVVVLRESLNVVVQRIYVVHSVHVVEIVIVREHCWALRVVECSDCSNSWLSEAVLIIVVERSSNWRCWETKLIALSKVVIYNRHIDRLVDLGNLLRSLEGNSRRVGVESLREDLRHRDLHEIGRRSRDVVLEGETAAVRECIKPRVGGNTAS